MSKISLADRLRKLKLNHRTLIDGHTTNSVRVTANRLWGAGTHHIEGHSETSCYVTLLAEANPRSAA